MTAREPGGLPTGGRFAAAARPAAGVALGNRMPEPDHRRDAALSHITAAIGLRRARPTAPPSAEADRFDSWRAMGEEAAHREAAVALLAPADPDQQTVLAARLEEAIGAGAWTAGSAESLADLADQTPVDDAQRRQQVGSLLSRAISSHAASIGDDPICAYASGKVEPLALAAAAWIEPERPDIRTRLADRIIEGIRDDGITDPDELRDYAAGYERDFE